MFLKPFSHEWFLFPEKLLLYHSVEKNTTSYSLFLLSDRNGESRWGQRIPHDIVRLWRNGRRVLTDKVDVFLVEAASCYNQLDRGPDDDDDDGRRRQERTTDNLTTSLRGLISIGMLSGDFLFFSSSLSGCLLLLI